MIERQNLPRRHGDTEKNGALPRINADERGSGRLKLTTDEGLVFNFGDFGNSGDFGNFPYEREWKNKNNMIKLADEGAWAPNCFPSICTLSCFPVNLVT